MVPANQSPDRNQSDRLLTFLSYGLERGLVKSAFSPSRFVQYSCEGRDIVAGRQDKTRQDKTRQDKTHRRPEIIQ